MISFNELGGKGWLGNQMFQYASLRGIAANRGYDWMIPPDDGSQPHRYSLFTYFLMTSATSDHLGYLNRPTHRPRGLLRRSTASAVHFDFDPALYEHCPDNVNLTGFFQSERYFQGIADVIRKDFQFKPSYLEAAAQIRRDNANPDEKVIGIHIRRGDYLKYPDIHPVMPVSYFAQALAELPAARVLVFTDDPAWARTQSEFSGDRFAVMAGNDAGVDLACMSLCDYLVISNSTFSWWGAWLSDAEKVIAPRLWFGPKRRNLRTDFLIPNRWTKL